MLYFSSPFALVTLEIGSHFLPRLTWTVILLFYTSPHHWVTMCVPPCPVFIGCDGSSNTLTSYLAWAQTVILPISTSQIVRITGISLVCSNMLNVLSSFWKCGFSMMASFSLGEKNSYLKAQC
jgi:hypothetical protein